MCSQKELAKREKTINELMQSQAEVQSPIGLTPFSPVKSPKAPASGQNKDVRHQEPLISVQIVLCFKLKNQLRNVYELLKERDLEIEHLKKNIKLTKIEEQERELELVYKEAARLRRSLEEAERTVVRLIKQRNLLKSGQSKKKRRAHKDEG